MRRKNAQLMAPRFDAHVIEFGRYDPDLWQVGIVALKAKRKRVSAPPTQAQRTAFKNMMRGGFTLKHIVRHQNFGSATNWSPVRTVRG